MKQQINLYQNLPVESKYRLNKRTVKWAYGILIFFLLIDTMYSTWMNHIHAQQINTLEMTVEKQKKDLADLLTQYPMINPKDLENSLQQLQKQLSLRIKVFNTLVRGAGFSHSLSGLGEVSSDNIWLTQITFSNLDQSISLWGNGITSLEIQGYLDRLAKEPKFIEMLFSLQSLTLITMDNNHKYGYLSFHATGRSAAIL